MSCRQDGHWTEVVSATEANTTTEPVSGSERKRREAVWELFTSQCVFLFDHLMVLKHVSLRNLLANASFSSNVISVAAYVKPTILRLFFIYTVSQKNKKLISK